MRTSIPTRRLSRALEDGKKAADVSWNVYSRMAGVCRKTMFNMRKLEGNVKPETVDKVVKRLGLARSLATPCASVSVDHLIEPIDFTRINGIYRQLRRKGAEKDAANYCFHAAIKLGESVKWNLNNLEIMNVSVEHRMVRCAEADDKPPKWLVRENSTRFLMTIPDRVFEVRLAPSANSLDMYYILNEITFVVNAEGKVVESSHTYETGNISEQTVRDISKRLAREFLRSIKREALKRGKVRK